MEGKTKTTVNKAETGYCFSFHTTSFRSERTAFPVLLFQRLWSYAARPGQKGCRGHPGPLWPSRSRAAPRWSPWPHMARQWPTPTLCPVFSPPPTAPLPGGDPSKWDEFGQVKRAAVVKSWTQQVVDPDSMTHVLSYKNGHPPREVTWVLTTKNPRSTLIGTWQALHKNKQISKYV